MSSTSHGETGAVIDIEEMSDRDIETAKQNMKFIMKKVKTE